MSAAESAKTLSKMIAHTSTEIIEYCIYLNPLRPDLVAGFPRIVAGGSKSHRRIKNRIIIA